MSPTITEAGPAISYDRLEVATGAVGFNCEEPIIVIDPITTINKGNSYLMDCLRHLLDDGRDALIGISWFDDGINDAELALLAVLDEVRTGSPQRYSDLLDSPSLQSERLSLPLGGKVRFFVFQDSPFTESINYAEEMGRFALFIEDFLRVPFPQGTVVGRTISKRNYDDVDEENVGGVYSIQDQIVFTAGRGGFDAPEVLLHEMAHLYFGGHIGAPTRLIEGAAEFLAFYALDDFGRISLSDR